MKPFQIYNQSFFPMHSLASFILLCLFSFAAQAAQPFGPNLMQDPGFEEPTAHDKSSQGKTDQLAPGWKLVKDKQDSARLTTALKDAAEGKSCLSLELAAYDTRGKQLSLYSPGVACDPGWYLASFWYRYEFEGKDQPQRLVYVERLNDVENGRRDDVIYHYFHERPAVSGQWDYTFILFRIRPEQKGVRFLFGSFGKETRFMLDNFRLYRLDENALPSQSPEPPVIFKTGIAADPILDPAASEGRAWRCEEGKHIAGAKITWSSQSNLSPGLYRLRFRLRQEKPSAGEALHLTASGDNGQGFDYVRPGDFSNSEKYQEFTLYWLYPFGGGHGFNWRFPGSGAYRFDQVVAEKVADVTMPEAWDLLAEGVKPSAIQPQGLPSAGRKAVLLAGLTEYQMGIESLLTANGMDAYRCDLETIPGSSRLGLTPALPDLDGTKVLIFCDVPARALSPLEQLRIREFVANGGGLIMFGGFYGYGHGGMKNSFIEEILPVAIRRAFDRIRLPEGNARVTENTFWFPDNYGDCAWLHDVELKTNAEVLLKAYGLPAVVKGTFGKGRVVAVLCTVLGEPQDPFWENKDWKAELSTLLEWASGKK